MLLMSFISRCYSILDAVIRCTVCESVGDYVVFGKRGNVIDRFAISLGIELLLYVSHSLWTGPEWASKPLSIRESKRATLMYELICNGIV
jgi:hypothetical protein